MPEKQINIAGVKFKPSEITSVTFDRNGTSVTVNPKQGTEQPKIGFKAQ